MSIRNLRSFLMMIMIAMVMQGAAPVSAESLKTAGKRAPIAQVVNSSGVAIARVNVGGQSFSRNLSSCFDGCSTGFKNVASGVNGITLTSGRVSTEMKIGKLAGFERNKSYSVNITRRGDSVCAALFERSNTDLTFNADRSKRKINSVCR